MKVLLFLIIWIQGDPEPMKGHIDVPDIKTCHAELGKLLNQPKPEKMERMQAGCFIINEGTPA